MKEMRQNLEPHKQDELDHNINQAFDLIKAQSNQNGGKINLRSKSCPWLLLLGAQGTGKTSLIKQAGLTLASPSNKNLGTVRTTKTIDWWVSEELVVIDPAARYGFSDNIKPSDQTYWQTFLQSLSKKISNPFDSVCLVIDLPSLTYPDGPGFSKLIHNIQNQIEILTKIQSPICLSIAITQCDYISGFAEFFNSLSPEEQQQAFGFSIIDCDQHAHFAESFSIQFERFIKFINNKLLERLHHEPNLERRLRLTDFPLQLEHLSAPLNKLIDSLPESARLILNNLFFCSAEQTANTIDFLSDDLKRSFDFESNTRAPLVATQKALFIPGMMHELTKPFAPANSEIVSNKKKWRRLIGYPIALLIVISSAFILHHGYKHNVNSLQTVVSDLSDTNKQGLLPNLDKLYELKHDTHHTLGSLIGFGQANKVSKKIHQEYTNVLRQEFGKYLQSILQEAVKEKMTHNSPALYDALRAYLMFAESDKMQPEFVNHWLANYWQHQLPQNKAYQHRLQHYLQEYLKLKNTHWRENKALVLSAQKILQKQPLAQLAFKMLQNNYSLAEIPVKSSVTIQGIDLSKVSIPKFYAKESFGTIFNKDIPALAKSYSKGNWVVGKGNLKEDNSTELKSALQKLYVKNYITAWQEDLSKITFKTPTSYQEAIDQINLITNIQSPVWQLYQGALEKAKKDGAVTIVDQYLNQDSLTERMPGQPKAQLMKETLQKLKQNLSTLQKAPSTLKASYDAAAKRFNSNGKDDTISATLKAAESLPTPIKQWMQQIAHGSWKLTLSKTNSYINALWKTDVVPFYTTKIKGRYPIFAKADNDITLGDFNHFFGPGGIIQNSFSTIRPFINMSQAYWTWKELDGESLNIPQSDLDMLIRASMIQKMFYTNDPDKPIIHFKLTPVQMSSGASQFVINIGGKMVRYLPGLQKTEKASWPGENGNFVTMRFSTINNQNPTYTTTGAWAWLRMLDHAHIQSTSDPHRFQVTFNLQGNQVMYDLDADNAVNPYLPNILSGFRVPEAL